MSHIPNGPYEKYVKRPLGCVLATGAFVVLSPVLGVTALATRKELGSPVLFSQERPGMIDPKTGEEIIFNLYKFRTMTDGRDEEGNLLSDTDRLTPFGAALRSTSIDELPELINIAKGDMSIVGPRPLLIQYLPYYTEEEARRHDVRPGLTGLAQINGRNNASWENRFKYDLKYVNHITLRNDVRIIALTIAKLIKKSDVITAGENEIPDFDIERGAVDCVQGYTS